MASTIYPEPRAFVLDLDGTLVDTLPDFVAVLALSFQDLGLPPPAHATVARSVGKGSAHLIRSCLTQQGADPACYEAAWARYQVHYQTLNGQQARLFEGVREGLQLLQAWGLPMACLTNKPARFARDLLVMKGLAGFFQQVFGGDDFARQKPDPLPLLKTCEALGTPPAQTWMIGDSRNDAEAAHAAGCPVVLMRYGYNHGEPIEQVPAMQYLQRLDEISVPVARAVGPAVPV